MKITYVHYNEMPSSRANTVNVARMCGAMADAGHEVTLICPPPRAFLGQFHAFYGIRPNYAVIASRLARWAPSRLLFILALIYHRLTGADLLYTRSILAAHLSTSMGIATVLELHNPPSHGASNRRRFSACARRPALRRVLLNSPATLADAVALTDGRPGLCVLAPHGIDISEREVALREGGGPLRVCYAGSFFVGRGVEFLLDVAELAPDVEFRLVGADAPAKARLEKDMQGRGISNTTIIERVPPGEVAQILKSCDACLAPYQKEVFHEDGAVGPDSVSYMSPLKIFDYVASGRPIVASDLPSISCILEDGVSGLLCEADDPAAWAGALGALRDDPDLRIRLAQEAMSVARRKYSWEARVQTALEDPR